MPKYAANQSALEKARSLIKSHQYVIDSDWSDAQPSTSSENKHLDQLGWDDYGAWYLGINTDASEETKGRFGFVYGDFQRVHRSGLIAAKQRAAQNDAPAVADAADKLLQLLDETRKS